MPLSSEFKLRNYPCKQNKRLPLVFGKMILRKCHSGK